MGTQFSYASQELNPENGYFVMGARLYDASSGRFLSRDPLAELFPNYSSYCLAYNSPLNFNDPMGLSPEKEKGEKFLGGLTYFMVKNSELIDGMCVGCHSAASSKDFVFSKK